MKKIIVAFSFFVSLKASATVDTLPQIDYIITKVVEVKTPVVRIDAQGNFFFRPATFCDCDKCQAIKGWKFLYNIYKKD